MGKVSVVLLAMFCICLLAKAKDNEYAPKISFKDVIESQVGVIKKVISLKNETKKLSSKVNSMENTITNMQQQQDVLSKKVSKLEKEIRYIKNNNLKGLVVNNLDNEGGKKALSFGKVNRNKEIIPNGPQNIFFCVEQGVSYIYKDPSWKSIKMGASYKGDTLQCLSPCGLEGNRYYWLHIINLRTGYKGYSMLNDNLRKGKCK